MKYPITLVVTDHVPLADKDKYEVLVDELHQLFEKQDGFLSVDIVRHSRPHQVEYTVLSRWSSEAAVTHWKQDKTILSKLSQIEAITGGTAQIVRAAGLGIWVDHAGGMPPKLPPAWKRIVMSVVAVFPLLMLLTTITTPVIEELPQSVQVFIIVCVLSALLTWPIMPWLGKILSPWLSAK